jgi:hypothetical protein
MISPESKRFLDLDHLADQVLSQDDRAMFVEAIQCYQIGSHRAAVILAWSVTADCLYRRIDELATDGDGTASKALGDLLPHKGTASYEEQLLTQCKKCDLFDDYEEKCLRFARDTRSKCAHPTGVLPSAEAVRNILHICSQTVLCREGYRGIAFIKQLIEVKLDDRYFFSEENRIANLCRYYYQKVPERLHPQFAAIASERVGGSTPQWKSNTCTFFAELYSASSVDVAQKLAQKFQAVEALDQRFYSVLVGLDRRASTWNEHVRKSAQAALRNALKTGRVDEFEFNSYGNLCALEGITADDNELFRARFSLLAQRLAQHVFLQELRSAELVAFLIDSLEDEDIRYQIIAGMKELLGSSIFAVSEADTDRVLDILLESDWHDDSVSTLFNSSTGWSSSLKLSLLKKTKQYLLHCSEELPDYIFVVFEVAYEILGSNPTTLPNEFEIALRDLVDGAEAADWFTAKGEVYANFIGQLDLLRTRQGAHLTILPNLTLPAVDEEVEADA